MPLRTPSIRHSGHAILVPKGGAALGDGVHAHYRGGGAGRLPLGRSFVRGLPERHSSHPRPHAHRPLEEIAHWIDLGPGLAAHLMSVSQAIGKALQESFEPQKVGLAIAGLEIPHAHVHVWPIHGPMSFLIDADEGDPPEPDWEKLEEAADSIRRTLEEFGFHQHVAD